MLSFWPFYFIKEQNRNGACICNNICEENYEPNPVVQCIFFFFEKLHSSVKKFSAFTNLDFQHSSQKFTIQQYCELVESN